MGRLYVDHCNHCPGENIQDDEGKHIGHKFSPDKCHYCTTKTFTESLGAYVNISHDIEKLKREIKERERGLDFWRKKLKDHYKTAKQHCGEGGVRIIQLYGVSVVLDWTTETFSIRFAKLERNPEA